jgi:hypothetical protein
MHLKRTICGLEIYGGGQILGRVRLTRARLSLAGQPDRTAQHSLGGVEASP